MCKWLIVFGKLPSGLNSLPLTGQDKVQYSGMDQYEITGRQMREARALLGLSTYEIAKNADISRITVRGYEVCGDEAVEGHTAAIRRLARYLESEGIRFELTGGIPDKPEPTMKQRCPGGYSMNSTSWLTRSLMLPGRNAPDTDAIWISGITLLADVCCAPMR